MNKIKLIITREYLTRVKKKSFLLITLLGPILLALLMVGVLWLGMKESTERFILVIDENHGVLGEMQDSDGITYDYQNISFKDAKRLFHASSYTDILYIPPNVTKFDAASLLFKKQPSATVLRAIEWRLEEKVEELKLLERNINKTDFYKVKTSVSIKPAKFTKKGEEKEIFEEASTVGFAFGLLMFMFIQLYGVQVMHGVIEEKANRIIEVIISSVKPVQLMMGKIVGVALVSFSQFLIWILLTIVVFSTLQYLLFGDLLEASNVISDSQMSSEMMSTMNARMKMAEMNGNPDNLLNRIPWISALTLYAFYFLGGYLLYSALFAAVGSAVDSETDAQQFMFPVMLPLIFSYMISFLIAQNPDGPAAFWFSMIPFTSPIVMMIRFLASGEGGVPIWEIGLSMLFLVIGFMGTTWAAAKIYRTGILMYGKKASYKELWKWLFYKA